MNLRARILGLITLSALSLFSCEEDISTIGLPPENNLGIFFADIPLSDKTTQIWVEGINTRSTSIAMAGAYQDPNFGLIEAKNYSEISGASVTYSSSASFDSVVLQMRISSVYGNSIEDITHDLEVYQLADSISLIEKGDLRSFTSSTTETLGDKIGDMSFQIYTDSVNLAFEDTGIDLADSIPSDSAFYAKNFDDNDLYIYLNKSRLDDDFGSTIFEELKTNQYDSIAEIAGLFKGIHLKANGTNGAVLSYILDSNSGLVFYYHEDGELKKVTYPLSSTRSYNNISPNPESNWNGSEIDDLSEFYSPYTTSNDKAYFQAGTNLLLKVDMSGIEEAMRDTVPDAIIQSAEIIMTGTESPSGLDPLPSLGYWLTSSDSLANENYQVANIPDISNSTIATSYDGDIDGYKVEVPLFIETLTSAEEFEFDQLVIAPINSTSTLPRSSIRRTVLNKENIKLRFFYTTPNK